MKRKTFGIQLREYRISRGLTIREATKKSGIEFTYWSKLENDKIKKPSESTINKINRALFLSANEYKTLFRLAKQFPLEVMEWICARPDVYSKVYDMPKIKRKDNYCKEMVAEPSAPYGKKDK